MAEKTKEEKKASSKIKVVELDYNKLADAIVKAEIKVKKEENEKKQHLEGLLVGLVSISFKSMFVICSCFMLLGIYALILFLTKAIWTDFFGIIGNIIACFIGVGVLIIIEMVGVSLLFSASDIKKERDRNYVVQIFSSMISAIALIIAMVALLKEFYN